MKTMTATETQTTSKVRRTKIVPCLTCPLCNKFFREATTISECMHTFCKECIWKKFSDECKTHCPVCDKDLGCYPLDRLRPDNALQDLRDKIFPDEEKTAKAPESVPVPAPVPEPVPSFPLPTNSKKKERSLSSLSTSPNKLSSHSCIVERREKAAAKKFLDEQESALAAFQLEKRSAGKKHGRMNGVEISEGDKTLSRTKSVARKTSIPKEYIPSTSQPQTQKVAEDNKTDQEHCQSETENVTSEIENQKTSLEPDLNEQIVPNEENSEKNAASWKGKAAMWEPLNCLMEAVENARSLESNNMQENAKSIIESNNMQENANIAVPVESSNNDSNPTKIMAATDQNEATPVQPEPIKIKTLRIKQHRRVKFAHDLNVPAELVAVNVPAEPVPVKVPAEAVPVKVPAEPVPVKVPAEPVPVKVPAVPVPAASCSIINERITPIWFSLVASEEKDVRASLPQIPSRYLRVKDVNLPVSFIKKYVVKKLGLAISEAEVELSLRGKPLSSSLQLKHVLEMWLETVPKSETIHTFAGDSAKEFVMVLSYGRKV